VVDELNKKIKHRLKNIDWGKQNYKIKPVPALLCVSQI